MLRPSLRKNDQMRPITLETGVNKWAEGSCLIKIGGTQVLCTASVDLNQPLWKRQQQLPGGWVNAEYGMLPRSVGTRKGREQLMRDHRCAEITRLISRSLRSVVDMERLGKHTITVDCDVIQADGGTRCAAITGGFVAMMMAMKWLLDNGRIREIPVSDFVAAVSVGEWGEDLVLDLDYEEDSKQVLDANIVMSGDGKLIEVQATGEAHPFTADQMNELLKLAADGCAKLFDLQKQVLDA